jgi:hypothetical protein
MMPVHHEEGIEFVGDEPTPQPPSPLPQPASPPSPPPARVVQVPIVSLEEKKKEGEEDIVFMDD